MDCRKQKPDDTNRKKWQNNEKENKTQTYFQTANNTNRF